MVQNIVRVFFFMICLLSTCSLAQRHGLHKYGTFNGLSSSEVYDLFQDSLGHLWIASDYGLSFYNGKDFKHFSTSDGLTDNTIFRIQENSDGEVWCNTFNNTLFSIDLTSQSFIPYKWNHLLRELPSKWVMSSFHVDNERNFYFTFANRHGYVKISENGVFKNLIYKSHDVPIVYHCWESSLENTFTFSGLKDSAVTIPTKFSSIEVKIPPKSWEKFGFCEAITFPDIEMTYAIFKKNITAYNHRTKEIRTIPLNANTTKIRKLNSEMFWVSTIKNGTHLYDKNGNFLFRIFREIPVSDILVDHENNFWVATLSDGIFHSNNINVNDIDPENESLSVSDLSWDGEKLWIGYEDGGVSIKTKDSLISIFSRRVKGVARLYFDENRKITYYVSNDYLYNNQSKDSIRVGASIGFEVYETPKGDSVLNWYQSGLFGFVNDFNKRTAIKTDARVTCKAKYKDVDYFGTMKGLYELSGGALVPVNNINRQFNSRIDAAIVFKGNLFLSSRGNGILIWDGKNLINLTKLQGLSSNFISKFRKENDSTIWFCTNAGLDRLTFESGNWNIQSLTINDGLKSNEVSDVEIVGDNIWIGTRSGVSLLNKSAFEQNRKSTNYFLSIDDIAVNDVSNIGNDSSFRYNQNRVAFKFSGISFLETEKLAFRYKLIGLENKWNQTTNDEVVYTELSPGEYTFVVQVKGQNKLWETCSITYDFLIRPPFWKTWWFVLVSTFGSISIIYFFFRYRVLIYNADILREILRQIMKRLIRRKQYLVITEAGKEVKIDTSTIQIVKADGNYIEIIATDKTYVFREKIGKFMDIVPDPLEFIRVKRSFIVRLDKVQEKGKKHVVVNDTRIDVGNTYLEELDKIIF